MKIFLQIVVFLMIISSFIACGDEKSAPTVLTPTPIVSAAQVTGGLPFIVIRMQFTDYKFGSSEAVWSQKIFGTSSGQLNDYYNEVSKGSLQLSQIPDDDTIIGGESNDSIITVTLNYPHPQNDTLSNAIFAEALSLTDDYVDYSLYDENNDSFISVDELQIMFIVAGDEWATYASGQARGGVWAHQYALPLTGIGQAPTLDAVRLMATGHGTYSCFGEHHFDHVQNATIGVMAHELGHAIYHIPDLYDTDSTSAGIGAFGLMASGAWAYTGGQNYGASPVHMSAWSKMQAGFITVDEHNSSENDINLTAASLENFNVVKVPINSNEYFLLENRQNLGYDKGLYMLENRTFTGGVAIWHINESVINAKSTSNWVNRDETAKGVDLEEARFAQLDYGPNYYGVIWNLFYAGNSSAFSDATTPNSKDDASGFTGIVIDNISSSASVMTFNLSK